MEHPLESADRSVGRDLRDEARRRARSLDLSTGAAVALPAAAAEHRFDALLGTFRVQQLRLARRRALGFFALMCLSAVYLQHHYVTDVVLGCAYALAALATITALDRHLASDRPGATRSVAEGAPT